MRWLAFRLQFESGHCKLASGDPTWRNGDACCVHFETQPLPTRLGWHAHQLPRGVRRCATFATLAVELGVPWLAFGLRRLRRAGFALLTGLQLAWWQRELLGVYVPPIQRQTERPPAAP